MDLLYIMIGLCLIIFIVPSLRISPTIYTCYSKHFSRDKSRLGSHYSLWTPVTRIVPGLWWTSWTKKSFYLDREGFIHIWDKQE